MPSHSLLNIAVHTQELIPSLQKFASEPNGRLNVVRFSVPSPEIFKRFLPFYLIWRITSLCVYLLYTLVVTIPNTATALKLEKNVDCVLVQNPPAMPLLVVVYIYCQYICKYSIGYTPAFIIDWHNLVGWA